MRPDLVVFDCDGVLVDTERIGVRVESAFLTAAGWPLTEDEVVERFVGRTDAYMRAEVEARLGDRLPSDWEADLHRQYRDALAAEMAPVDGVFEALEALERAGVATCVASSGTHDKMRFTLGQTGLYRWFEGRIFSATEVARGKPAPDLFLRAADRMGAKPSACAVVEDSASGVEAARAAGMRVCAYAGSVTPAERLAGPDTVVFDDMRRLPALLGLA